MNFDDKPLDIETHESGQTLIVTCANPKHCKTIKGIIDHFKHGVSMEVSNEIEERIGRGDTTVNCQPGEYRKITLISKNPNYVPPDLHDRVIQIQRVW